MSDAKDARLLAQELVVSLASAVWSRRFYPPEHPVNKGFVERVQSVLARLLAGPGDVTLGIVGEEIVYEGRPILGPVLFLENFVRELKRRDIEKIAFKAGTTPGELSELIAMINTDPWEVLAWGSPRIYLQNREVTHILLSRLRVAKGTPEEEEGGSPALQQMYRDGLELFRKISTGIAAGEPLPMDEIGGLADVMVRQAARYKDSLVSLTNLRSHDEYTYTHAVNVALLTVLQGEALGLEEATLNDLGIAGLLHDIGKLVVPPSIINKKGPLDEAEWARMRQHPVEGAMLLRKEENVPPVALLAAFQHHCRVDLSGYPRMDRIPRQSLASMMVAVSDCYDAMRSLRSYQKDLTPEEAYSRMQGLKGKVLEENLVDLFFSVVGLYPPGTFVRLDDGRIGMVLEANRQDILRPTVRIVRNADGEDVRGGATLDIAKEFTRRGEGGAKIVGSVDAVTEGIVPSNFQ